MLLILETLWFLLFFSFQSAKWSVTGDRTGALILCEWSTIQCIYICLNLIFFRFDTFYWELLIFYCVLRSWSCYFILHFYWLQFLRSLNSFELFVLLFRVLNFWTRAISLSLHCVFRGRGVTLFLSFRGFRFRDVARGSEPMIRFLTMVKALTSLIVGMSCISGMPCILYFMIRF